MEEIETKKCYICKQEKNISEFPKSKNYCKSCHNERQKKYYLEHKKEKQEYDKKYRKEKKDNIKAYQAKYRKTVSYKTWQEKSLEKRRITTRLWQQSDHGKACIARNRFRRRLITRSLVNDLTENDWLEIKISQNFKCAYCGKQEPEIELTKDHIVPVTKGGHNTKENIQGLCRVCNIKKHNKIDSAAFQMFLTSALYREKILNLDEEE